MFASPIMNPSRGIDSPRKYRLWLWICTGIFFAVMTFIVLLPAESPNGVTVNLAAVGEVQTNGEHWVLFRFDAPKYSAVIIQQALTVGADNQRVPTLTRAESFPEPRLSVYGLVKANSSKLLKVRRLGGGDWHLRIEFLKPLGFTRQWLERSKAMWRMWGMRSPVRSPAPWKRTYIERGQRFVQSGFVKTSEAAFAPLPPVQPCSVEDSPSDLFSFPIVTDMDTDSGKGRKSASIDNRTTTAQRP